MSLGIMRFIWSLFLVKRVEGSGSDRITLRGSLSFARPGSHVVCDSRSESRIDSGHLQPSGLKERMMRMTHRRGLV